MNLNPQTTADRIDWTASPIEAVDTRTFHTADRLITAALGHASTTIDIVDRVLDDPYGAAADTALLASMMDDIVRHTVTIAPSDPDLRPHGHRVVRFVLRLADIVLSAQAVTDQAADAADDPDRFDAIKRMFTTGRPLIDAVHGAWRSTIHRTNDPMAADGSTTTDVLRATERSRVMHPARHGETAHAELINLDEHLRHVVSASLQLASIADDAALQPLFTGPTPAAA